MAIASKAPLVLVVSVGLVVDTESMSGFCSSCGEPARLCHCKGRPSLPNCTSGSGQAPVGPSPGRASDQRTGLPACKGCGKPVQGRTISAMGGAYHPECFKCAGCGGAFVDRAAGFVEHGGCAYHRGCFTAPARACHFCSQPLIGQAMKAAGAEFHPQCLPRCGTCGVSLEAGWYHDPSTDVRYCAAHAPRAPARGGRRAGSGTVSAAALRLPRPPAVEQLDMRHMLKWAETAAAQSDPTVHIIDWSRSFADGRAFLAILRTYFPEAVDASVLASSACAGEGSRLRAPEVRSACAHAFRLADELAGVPQLLDEGDMARNYPLPDEKSVITYVCTLWGGLARAAERTEGKAGGVSASA